MDILEVDDETDMAPEEVTSNVLFKIFLMAYNPYARLIYLVCI